MKTRLISSLGALALVLCSVAWAEPSIQVSFPEKGRYLYWMEYKDADGKEQITAPKQASGEEATIDLEDVTVGTKLQQGELKIYDTKSGNVSAKKLENLTGKKDLKLKSADFDLVHTVRIVLQPQDAKPNEVVESAVVTLKDANSDEHQAMVDPSTEGVAVFTDVAAGEESIKISYDGGSMSMDTEVPAERDSVAFEKSITINDKVKTIKVAAASAETTEQSAAASPKKSAPAKKSGPGILSTLMAFVFLALLGFIAYVLLKSRGITMKDSLQKMGVQLPEDGAPAQGSAQEPQAPQVDPNICPFCGQRKDPATGNCACTVIPGAPAGVASGNGTPRLIGVQGNYSGHIFDITAESLSIGRDITNPISLASDSTVSRVHARISKANGTCSIADEGSSNGTFVNGIRVAGAQTLQAGDELQIGNTKFRFES